MNTENKMRGRFAGKFLVSRYLWRHCLFLPPSSLSASLTPVRQWCREANQLTVTNIVRRYACCPLVTVRATRGSEELTLTLIDGLLMLILPFAGQCRCGCSGRLLRISEGDAMEPCASNFCALRMCEGCGLRVWRERQAIVQMHNHHDTSFSLPLAAILEWRKGSRRGQTQRHDSARSCVIVSTIWQPDDVY